MPFFECFPSIKCSSFKSDFWGRQTESITEEIWHKQIINALYKSQVENYVAVLTSASFLIPHWLNVSFRKFKDDQCDILSKINDIVWQRKYCINWVFKSISGCQSLQNAVKYTRRYKSLPWIPFHKHGTNKVIKKPINIKEKANFHVLFSSLEQQTSLDTFWSRIKPWWHLLRISK